MFALAIPTTGHAQSVWGPLDIGGTSASGIDNAGRVAVTSSLAGFGYSFVWSPAGEVVDLGGLDSDIPQTFAQGINDAGQVVGWSVTSAGSRAFIWSAAGGMLDLGTPSGVFGINNLGTSLASATPWLVTGRS